MTTLLVDRVLEHAARDGARACVHCISNRRGEATRTWGEVARDAGRAAAGWASCGVRRGDVVVLIGTHHIDFYAAWLGAVWLGAVPTVLAEPGVRVHKEIYRSRLVELMARVGARAIATDPKVELDVETSVAARTHYDVLANTGGDIPARHQATPDELLLLQHSSGTTGLQKGVMLTQGAVAAHAEAYGHITALGPNDVVATWLPLYHDMGLIAAFVGPLWAGASVAWLSPFEWVASPGMLLDVIARFHATHCWLPNFAFLFLAQRVRDRGDANARLSSLRHLVNCSEVVTTDAVDAFTARFTKDGFDEGAHAACYAMAENVYAMTSTTRDAPLRRRVVDRDVWRADHVARPAAGGALTVAHVSSGRPVPGVQVRIVNDSGVERPPLSAGRVLVRSPFLFAGYFRRDDLNGPQNSRLLDAEGFFDTGDLGYLDDEGHLYVTGRRKDVIITAGKNIYPHDVEAVADATVGVHPGRAVAFGVAVRAMGTDGVVLLAESDATGEARAAVAAELRRGVATLLELDLADVRVVERGALRKSSSGKLARSGNRDWYLEGRFGAPLPSVDGAGADAATDSPDSAQAPTDLRGGA